MSNHQTLMLAALGWMHRHHQAHKNDQQLCAWAVQFLMDNHDISERQAENAVIRAYGDFRNNGNQCYLDISLSASSVAAIRDPQTNMLFTIPVALIVDRLCLRGKKPVLHLVKTDVN